MNKFSLLASIAIFATALTPAAALAKKGHGGDKGSKHGSYEDRHDHNEDRQDRHHDDDDSRVTINIGFNDRAYIENHMANDYRRNCPPGLAKKHNGCMPPGQVKKYRVGYPLPHDVVFIPVTGDLLDHLSPVPRGYRYVQVDKDILLIGEATKKVIDAVTLLSAVGN